MLTKEFAQRVELSEKQVRKIVQHLEERGYQLSKTAYRGREATDFKEEDIELFRDIADKVKQTNSYDLAFDELEKEKDFLQVIVKDEDSQLPTDQNVAQLVEDLRSEIQKMREERQMLGQMINQVHQQQQELKDLQTEITNKIDANTESLKTIQTSQEAIQSSQEKQAKEIKKANTQSSETVSSPSLSENKEKVISESTSSTKSESASTSDSLSTSQSESSNSLNGSASNSQSPSTTVSTSEQPESTHSESTINSNSTTSSHSPNEMNTQPREEKKGFFARLFNL